MSALRIEVKGMGDAVLENYKLLDPATPSNPDEWTLPGVKVLARDFFNEYRMGVGWHTHYPFSPGLVHIHHDLSEDARGRLRILVERRGVILLQLKADTLTAVKGFSVKYDS